MQSPRVNKAKPFRGVEKSEGKGICWREDRMLEIKLKDTRRPRALS